MHWIIYNYVFGWILGAVCLVTVKIARRSSSENVGTTPKPVKIPTPPRIGATYNAIDIANYILCYEYQHERYTNNLCLQKMLYFVQAKFLFSTGNPCFGEDMIARDYGPVVLSVDQEYRRFGYGSIPWPLIEKISYVHIYEKDLDLIDSLLEQISQYSTNQLREIIQCQTPWKQGRLRYDNKITKESIYEFWRDDNA